MGNKKEMPFDYSHTPHEGSPVSKQGSINPFKPHHMANVVTLFKYRWLHAFPLNLKVREHHLKVSTGNIDLERKVWLISSFFFYVVFFYFIFYVIKYFKYFTITK